MCTYLKIANELPFPVFFSGALGGGASSQTGLLRNGARLDTPVPLRASEPSQSGGLEGGGHSLPVPCRRAHPHSRDKDHILPAGNARAGRTVLSTPFPSCFLPLGQLPAPGSWGPRSEHLGLRFLASSLQVSPARNFCMWTVGSLLLV